MSTPRADPGEIMVRAAHHFGLYVHILWSPYKTKRACRARALAAYAMWSAGQPCRVIALMFQRTEKGARDLRNAGRRLADQGDVGPFAELLRQAS